MYGLREFLDNIKKSYSGKASNVKNYVNKKITSVDYIKANALTLFVIYYGKIVATISDNYKKIYNSNIVVKTCVDSSVYYSNYIYSMVIRKKIEPMSSYWISTSVLSKRDKNRYVGEEYTLLESYEFIKNPQQSIEGKTNCETSYNEMCDTLDSIVLNSQNYIEGLVKMKVGEHYVFRVFDNNNGQFDEFKLPLVPSKAKFWSIEYTHPLMKKGIVFELNKNVYLVGNQILSPTFVKSYLEYQSELYHFDMEYVLKIMDSDINSFELGFDRSVVLTEDGYSIIV
jgi:hypothetical protein